MSDTHFGIKFGVLHVLLFPLSAVFALAAILMVVSALLDGGESEPDQRVDDGCGSVELALPWLNSVDPTDRERGTAVATAVWERSLTDDAYSIALRRDCPVQVVTMLDLAGLSHDP